MAEPEDIVERLGGLYDAPDLFSAEDVRDLVAEAISEIIELRELVTGLGGRSPARRARDQER